MLAIGFTSVSYKTECVANGYEKNGWCIKPVGNGKKASGRVGRDAINRVSTAKKRVTARRSGFA